MDNTLVDTSPAEVTSFDEPVKPRLLLIKALLTTFHRLGVKYCHWKSNEHLEASMTGDTDLDILFDEHNKAAIEKILKNYDFKKFVPVKEKRYRDIEDFIGLDTSTGKIIHVHAHWKLTLGELYLKGYQLDIEKKVLDTRVYDPEFGIYRCLPAIELVLLYFRYALKARNRDHLKYYFKRIKPYNKYVLAEYHWLKARCTTDEIRQFLESLIPGNTSIYNLVTKEFNHGTILKLSGALHKVFKNQRLYSPLKATMFRWQRELQIKINRKTTKYLNQPVISQRLHQGTGLVIAILGADGSGKSTVIQELVTTFKKKIDVHKLYMGKGKSGESSSARKILKRIKKSYSKGASKQSINKPADPFINPKRSLKSTLFRCLEAVVVAKERRNKLKRIRMAKMKGLLIICDRFPQNQLMGYNDGPLLTYLLRSKNFLFRYFAEIEAKVYQLARENPPDIVFKLIADAHVIAARKPSMASMEMLELKIEGTKCLQFNSNCKVITIDANQPLNDVVVSVKNHVWDSWS